MRLGINATFLNERPTGVGVFTLEVSRRLCRLHEATALFSSVPAKAGRPSCERRVSSHIQGSMNFVDNLARFLYINSVLPLRLKKEHIDVLFCPSIEYPFALPCPCVVTVHDLHPVYFPEQFGRAAAHFRIALRVLHRFARRVIVPSRFVMEELLRVSPISSDRVDVVQEGYDNALFRFKGRGIKTDSLQRSGITNPYILFVGSYFPYKNVLTLISAFQAIRHLVPHDLVLVGKLEVSRESLSDDPRIRYLDYVCHTELPAYYSSADMLVHPSLVEGFGLTILEAMACGTPVIASRGGALPEVVGDAGILFDPLDAEGLSRRMLEVATREDLRQHLRERGLENVKNFSWDNTAAGVLRSCERAIMDDGC